MLNFQVLYVSFQGRNFGMCALSKCQHVKSDDKCNERSPFIKGQTEDALKFCCCVVFHVF